MTDNRGVEQDIIRRWAVKRDIKMYCADVVPLANEFAERRLALQAKVEELEGENEELEARLQSLEDFCAAEIRKMPKGYVKWKANG